MLEAALLAELELPAPRPPRCCRCSKCGRRLGPGESGVLIRTAGALELYCLDDAPVPVNSTWLAMNTCWHCRRVLLISLDIHTPPFCSSACSRRAEASAANRRTPDPWAKRDELKILRRAEEDRSAA